MIDINQLICSFYCKIFFKNFARFGKVTNASCINWKVKKHFERTIASKDWLFTFRRFLFTQTFAFILPRAGCIWTILKHWLFCFFSARSSWRFVLKMQNKISPIKLLGHLTEVRFLRLWESFFPRIHVFLDEILDKWYC